MQDGETGFSIGEQRRMAYGVRLPIAGVDSCIVLQKSLMPGDLPVTFLSGKNSQKKSKKAQECAFPL
jgi:hypothetical protein